MVEVRTYALKPTSLIPNSPHVLIHYPGLFLEKVSKPDFNCTQLYDLYKSNGWESQWVARYGPTQTSHYHSGAHEAMTVISGEGATIRFGVADTSDDAEAHTHGNGHEDGGIWIEAKKGDVFILPAGVAHKTYDPRPGPVEFAFFQCKDENGNVIRDEQNARAFFEGITIGKNFQMMGSYPFGNEWDFAVGGDHKGRERLVWDVPVPERDPVLGTRREGMCGLWHQRSAISKL
ncbi:hypothetical protein DPSP01_008616 [Paraphaeosphaeria sporulosa]|uniref:Cupin type-1 domain-containing protein n=1 Tax=Paraphaeosphaeria sporulosa TaxID=1460663 RepID=A0A177BYB8_9PLEO|nr:uncharacterized protein CC84DRAFT_1200019 [Paraphaeosphaeria sporulosa]OAF99319.1 hypothetical protein CC84DRAFT_1200019 [Paraphaeosphaeria sporulosa]